ncbi:argininosuccinate lyase [Histoplasma ohiense]
MDVGWPRYVSEKRRRNLPFSRFSFLHKFEKKKKKKKKKERKKIVYKPTGAQLKHHLLYPSPTRLQWLHKTSKPPPGRSLVNSGAAGSQAPPTH